MSSADTNNCIYEGARSAERNGFRRCTDHMAIHKEHGFPSGQHRLMSLFTRETSTLRRAGVTCRATLKDNDLLFAWQ